MKRLSGIFAFACLMATAGSVSLRAQSITQTFTFPSTATDVNGVATNRTFKFFQSAGAPAGAILDTVTVRTQLSQTLTSQTVSAGATAQTLAFQTATTINITGTAPLADRLALAAGLPFQAVLFSVGDGVTQYLNVPAN